MDEIRDAVAAEYREENEEDRAARLSANQRYIYENVEEKPGFSMSAPKFATTDREYVQEMENELSLRGEAGRAQGDLHREIVLGLGEHQDTALLKRKGEHAPIPWASIDEDGNRLSDETLGILDLSDIQETVLFSSSRGKRVRQLMEDMTPFFLSTPSEDLRDDEVLPPAFLSIYRQTKTLAFRGGKHDAKQAKHVEKALFDNFMSYGNPLCPIYASKIDQHVKTEYGFRNHIFEEDHEMGIAAFSYAITDRYYIALFLNVQDYTVRQGDKRAARRLFPKREEEGSVGPRPKRKKKRNDVAVYFQTKKRTRIGEHLSSSITEKATKSASKERKRKIMEKRLGGLVEMVVYSCSCVRH